MWKSILAGVAALAIAGSSLVYAQNRFGDRDRDRDPPRAETWASEDRDAFLEARIAALRAGLRLSPEQERNWPAFETAIRDLVKNRRQRWEDWRNRERREDPTERLRRRAEALTSAGADLRRLAEAQAPLYGSLDEGQKRRFVMLARRLSPGLGGAGLDGWRDRHWHRHGWHGERHHAWRGHGWHERHWRDHHRRRGDGESRAERRSESRSDSRAGRGADGRALRPGEERL